MNLYYKIWVDCIRVAKRTKGNWKLLSLLLMSFVTTINFLFCFIVLIPIIKQYILKSDKIDFVSFLIFGNVIFILSFLVHYFLIYYSKKYLSLLQEKRIEKGLFSKYYISSFLSLLISYYFNKLIMN